MSYVLEKPWPIDPALMRTATCKYPRPKAAKSAYRLFHTFGILQSALMGLGGMVLAFILLRQTNMSQTSFGVAYPILGIVIAYGVILAARRAGRVYSDRAMLLSPLYAGNTRYELNASGFVMSSENVEWRVGWPAIEHAIKDTKGLFFYAGAFSYVIDARVFAEGQMDEVWQDIERWRQGG